MHCVLNNLPTRSSQLDTSNTPAICMSNSNTPTDGQQAVLAPATLNSSSFKTRCILQNHAEEVTTPRVAEFSINGALVAIGYESGFLEVCLVYSSSTVSLTVSKDTGNMRRLEPDTMVQYRSQSHFSSLAPRVLEDLVRFLGKWEFTHHKTGRYLGERVF